jgi:NAD(P)-dependent dehydrogenase (short-subunit alcohol dehydrogenase family)
VTERIVITGANRGLGLELARMHAARSDDVWAGCRRPDDASDLHSVTPHVLAVDMGVEASIDAFADGLGPAPIDVVYNNAGIDARAFGVDDAERDVLQISGEHFLEVMRVNAVGPMLLTRALVERLSGSARPRVVHVTSQAGSMEVAHRLGRDVSYDASKAALNMVGVRQSVHLPEIIVVAIHPGFLKTDMGGTRADMTVDEGAAGIIATVDALTLDDTGTFLRWDGSIHPW